MKQDWSSDSAIEVLRLIFLMSIPSGVVIPNQDTKKTTECGRGKTLQCISLLLIFSRDLHLNPIQLIQIMVYWKEIIGQEFFFCLDNSNLVNSKTWEEMPKNTLKWGFA